MRSIIRVIVLLVLTLSCITIGIQQTRAGFLWQLKNYFFDTNELNPDTIKKGDGYWKSSYYLVFPVQRASHLRYDNYIWLDYSAEPIGILHMGKNFVFLFGHSFPGKIGYAKLSAIIADKKKPYRHFEHRGYLEAKKGFSDEVAIVTFVKKVNPDRAIIAVVKTITKKDFIDHRKYDISKVEILELKKEGKKLKWKRYGYKDIEAVVEDRGSIKRQYVSYFKVYNMFETEKFFLLVGEAEILKNFYFTCYLFPKNKNTIRGKLYIFAQPIKKMLNTSPEWKLFDSSIARVFWNKEKNEVLLLGWYTLGKENAASTFQTRGGVFQIKAKLMDDSQNFEVTKTNEEIIIGLEGEEKEKTGNVVIKKGDNSIETEMGELKILDIKKRILPDSGFYNKMIATKDGYILLSLWKLSPKLKLTIIKLDPNFNLQYKRDLEVFTNSEYAENYHKILKLLHKKGIDIKIRNPIFSKFADYYLDEKNEKLVVFVLGFNYGYKIKKTYEGQKILKDETKKEEKFSWWTLGSKEFDEHGIKGKIKLLCTKRAKATLYKIVIDLKNGALVNAQKLATLPVLYRSDAFTKVIIENEKITGILGAIISLDNIEPKYTCNGCTPKPFDPEGKVHIHKAIYFYKELNESLF